MKEVNKAIARARETLKTIPKERLDEIYNRVKAMNLTGPTLTEILSWTNMN